MSHGCNVPDCPGDCHAAEGEDLGAEVRRLRAECARKIEPLSNGERFEFLFAIADVAIESSSSRIKPETEAALSRWLDRCQGKGAKDGKADDEVLSTEVKKLKHENERLSRALLDYWAAHGCVAADVGVQKAEALRVERDKALKDVAAFAAYHEIAMANIPQGEADLLLREMAKGLVPDSTRIEPLSDEERSAFMSDIEDLPEALVCCAAHAQEARDRIVRWLDRCQGREANAIEAIRNEELGDD